MHKAQQLKLLAGIAFAACLSVGVSAIAQPSAPPAGGAAAPAGTPRPRPPQNQIPVDHDVVAMQDAAPLTAPAKPKKARKVLVIAKAAGYVHPQIPLVAATVKELGERTGAYATTITYDAADVTAANLAQYDVVFLADSTGAFLDDPNNAEVTAARRKALLDFVRNGKGLAAVHAAADSYHGFDPAPAGSPAGTRGPHKGTWPEFNALLGTYYKSEWRYPTEFTVKIDDKKSPLTAMFAGRSFRIHDEVFAFPQEVLTRKNVHVLTSLDYTKLSDKDKAAEPEAGRRTDGDYPVSWIKREGKGRVFYEAFGHDEHVYAMSDYLKHILAGIQYAAGDLAADDSPSSK